ncbi:alkylglycerone-phosphate synthase [Lentibacillus kapialis]|uniref:Alkylglycerone-phosphate synthase n=1 Tax=Lentibacillus kapialis TaxID=340214 RepID=A0A917UYX0_9BACI|nr:FAD-binding oxidoreductase [Lentibacillus kapialis]GGJ98392.1 alkylglycerone-phosphate synthase [Lentibacillus kapialis]
MKLDNYGLEMFRFELEEAVGLENVITVEETREELSIDQYWLTHMWKEKGKDLTLPSFIVRPGATEETSKVMRICNTYKIPVVPRGGGSGTAGGAATIHGGIVLDLTRMDKVIDIDEKSLILTAQTGINGRVLEDYLNEKGLMLAHYPSSVDISTLGGYIAARGSGVMSTKYGKAEDMVLSVEVVLPDGRIIDTLTTPNHACGPGLLQLFVGSEGTLGVITKVRMRLDPLPESRMFRMIQFSTIHEGLEAGREIMISRLKPAVIRLYDPGSTEKSLKTTGVDLDGNYMVLMFDGYKELAEIEMKKAVNICLENGGKDLGTELGKHWWDTRYVAYKPPVHPAYPLLYGTPETVTTYDNIEKVYIEKKKLIEEKYKQWNAKYTAHFSHWYSWGTMIYDRFYVENPPEDAKEAFRLYNEMFAESSRINLENGAILNEHHGIGFKLGWLMHEQYGDSFDVLLDIKKVIDPKCIMNPGKLGFGIW